jgi:hypothetical protein
MVEKQDRSDRMARRRDGLMLLFAGSWFVWQVLQFEPVRRAFGFSLQTMEVIAASGLVIWGTTLVLLVAWCVRLRRDRRLRGMMGDELTRLNSARSMVAGYWALTLGVAVAIIAMAAKLLEPMAIMEMLCMLTFVPILRFVWLERAANA